MSIKIDLKVFLFGFIFFLTKQIEIYAILMLFAFLHELGHLCAGLVLGFPIKSIGINPFGFQISFHTKIEDYNQKIKKGNELCFKKIIIALAGPMVNLFVIIACLFFPTNSTVAKDIIIYSNLLLAIFNLLPIYPLDGGRILKEILHICKGKENSYRQTIIVSKITTILLTIATSILILYVHNIAFLFILAYLWYLMCKNQKEYHLYLRTMQAINN